MSWMFPCSGSVGKRGCAGRGSEVVVTASSTAAVVMLDVCQWRCEKAPLALGAIGLGTVPGSGGCVVVVGGGRVRDAHECREVPVGRLLVGCAVCKGASIGNARMSGVRLMTAGKNRARCE